MSATPHKPGKRIDTSTEAEKAPAKAAIEAHWEVLREAQRLEYVQALANAAFYLINDVNGGWHRIPGGYGYFLALGDNKIILIESDRISWRYGTATVETMVDKWAFHDICFNDDQPTFRVAKAAAERRYFGEAVQS